MKYKLKKWYPSLNPRIKKGAIFKKTCNKTVKGEDHKYIHDDGICPYLVNAHEVENNPEFWEKVEEKNYKILEYKGVYSGKYIKERMLDSDVEIYSVKRLSDGEVFTIGDILRFTGKPPKVNRTIEKFTLNKDDKLLVHFKEDKTYRGGYFLSIFSHYKHVDMPLFTTEDGVDIYEGDEYYFFNTTRSNPKPIYNVATPVSGKLDDLKYFFSKEKAKECIKKRNPKYSKADIEEALGHIDVEELSKNVTHVYFNNFWKKLNE